MAEGRNEDAAAAIDALAQEQSERTENSDNDDGSGLGSDGRIGVGDVAILQQLSNTVKVSVCVPY